MTKREQMQQAIEAAKQPTATPPPNDGLCEMARIAKYGSGNSSTTAAVNPPKLEKKPKPPRLPKKPRTPDALDNEQAVKGRLPDGAKFTVRYNAKEKFWHGILSVPRESGAPHEFEGRHSGVFKLLAKLDDFYRQWKLTQSQSSSVTAPPPPSADVRSEVSD